MNKLLVCFLALLAVVGDTASVLANDAAVQATYYVSPGGNDLSAGTEAAPFKTIERARDAVRQINQIMTDDILVVIGGGEYPIKSTIEFGPKDSGKNGHSVTYRAKAGETPLLTGGVRVNGWARTPGTSLFQASVTSVNNFRQMYVNGNRAQRAVSSNPFTAKDWHYDETGSRDGVIVDQSPILSYENSGDMELVQVSNWSFHRIPIKNISVVETGESTILMDPHPSDGL